MTLDQLNANAHYATYAATAVSVTGWGLHLSDVAVIVSSFAATCGAVIQVLSYLERRRSPARGVEETKPDGKTD